jgi:hypothetical protein
MFQLHPNQQTLFIVSKVSFFIFIAGQADNTNPSPRSFVVDT